MVLTGDIGNAFIQVSTKENKICTRCGSKFGAHAAGAIAIVICALLYGFTTSVAERVCAIFAGYLRDMGFKPTQYDHAAWMMCLCEDGKGICYILLCTHINDFEDVSNDHWCWVVLESIAKVFLIKEYGPHYYYHLGNNYKKIPM